MLAKTSHTSNWYSIAGEILHINASTDLFASDISTCGSGYLFWFVVPSQVRSMPKRSVTGQCAHPST